ncbi:hypothetical protein D3C72_1523330 [compost metagenome]
MNHVLKLGGKALVQGDLIVAQAEGIQGQARQEAQTGGVELQPVAAEPQESQAGHCPDGLLGGG